MDIATMNALNKIPRLVDVSAESIHIEEFKTFEGGDDYSPAILAAIAYVKTNKLYGYELKFDPGKVYKINSTIILPVGILSLNLNGATLNASGIESGYAIMIVEGEERESGLKFLIRNGKLMKTQNTKHTTDGIFIGRHPNSTHGNSSFSGLQNVFIEGFRRGQVFGSHTWLNYFENISIGRCYEAGIFYPSGTVNSGENIYYMGGKLFDNKNADNTACDVVIEGGSNPDMTFNCVSLDYSQMCLRQSAGHLTFLGCHFENNNINELIQCIFYPGNRIGLTVVGGHISGGPMDISNPFKEPATGRPSLITSAGGHAQILIQGLVINRYELPDTEIFTCLDNDKPEVTISSINYTVKNKNMADVSAYTSLIDNPGFESDLRGWSFSGSTGYTGVIDNTVSHKGTKSFKISSTQTVGNATVKQGVPIPLSTGKRIQGTGWLKTTYTDATPAYAQYAQARFIFYNDKGEVIETKNFITDNKISITTDWTKFGDFTTIPPGAVKVDYGVYVNALKGDVWIDDLQLWVM